MCREDPNLVKIGQKYRFIVASDIISPYYRSLQLKWYQAVWIAEEVQKLCERATMLRYSALPV